MKRSNILNVDISNGRFRCKLVISNLFIYECMVMNFIGRERKRVISELSKFFNVIIMGRFYLVYIFRYLFYYKR